MGQFWVNEVIYSNSQPSLGTRQINGGGKFSEIKVQKHWVLMLVIYWNLATYLVGKTNNYCVWRWKKNRYREYDHRGTQMQSLNWDPTVALFRFHSVNWKVELTCIVLTLLNLKKLIQIWKRKQSMLLWSPNSATTQQK